jgi:hypothetical protein
MVYVLPLNTGPAIAGHCCLYKTLTMEENIKTAIDGYIKQLQEYSDNYYKTDLPNSWELKQYPTYSYEQGKRWVKVIRTGPGEHSVFCFIDPVNGDILKAAGWNAPAKGKRSNVLYDKRPLYSGALYR